MRPSETSFVPLMRIAPNRVFFSVLLSMFAGMIYSLLIPLILEALQAVDPALPLQTQQNARFLSIEVSKPRMALAFALVCVAILVCRTAAQVILRGVSLEFAAAMRRDIYVRIVKAPLCAMEAMGSARFITALTTDITNVMMGARALPNLLINVVTLLGMLGFMLYLNHDAFWFLLKCILFGVVTYQLPVLFGQRFFARAGAHFDALQEDILALIRGFKELKLNDEKKKFFFERSLTVKEREYLSAQRAGEVLMNVAGNYGDLLCFFVIGATIFVFINYHAISNTQLLGVTMALLYVTGPIDAILSLLPQLAVSRTAMSRLRALFEQLPAEQYAVAATTSEWDRIRLEQITHVHRHESNESGFSIGPIDLELRAGEVTFVIGGNGSGKSTLAKIMTTHYAAGGGRMLFGTDELTAVNVESYRQSIAAIFSDYYLFKNLYRVDELFHAEVKRYLSLFGLEDKVTFENNTFSTLDLSDGQRRRLALIAALTENRRFYLFDEWAADQDRQFKDLFYFSVLPQLREQGKIVVVITHDDRYFGVADQIISMSDGKIIGNWRNRPLYETLHVSSLESV